ncbi:MAG TPA: 3-phosphoshikimate 1-carboxyvinyltransferase [Candidatus Borkfalkia avistercoris]|uniref:3-phosphoshikimate 1-carboxyvinyltransferase n=1 Tax=Candidatus Borkfalkia avistercoris TaxID=2838504 RepID=A0A9D2CZ45_9FIRM|nr:3-phosphoshikimate 1-carboxyvinyltransferase [Candidatus Borkfalkia avistercoris]
MIISPRSDFAGEFAIPGDKSITHRAVMFNAMAEGEALVTNALLGEDCLSTASCMRALGAEVSVQDGAIRVKGAPLHDAECFCGNSGTTMRLLMGLIAGQRLNASLTGDASLSKRPMERVAKPLRLLGADIETTDGTAPVYVRSAKLSGREVDTATASAQVKSALLLAALGADGETFVHESVKTRDHTERMLAAMGADIRVIGNTVRVKKSALRAADVEVPGDISSAAYFMALGALLGETLCKNVGVNPTRTGILSVFDQMGVIYSLENERTVCGEPVADIRVKKSALKPIVLSKEIMPSLIDELPVIAVLCAYAEGESVITGAEELRIKESDRIKTTAEMLANFGGDVMAREDGFVIRGRKTLAGGSADSYLDHRIAMSAAVALAASEKGGEIKNAECVNISFPGFYGMLG